MMRLICNGVSVDLYENANIQFKGSNSLFAFGNLKCERTTQFKLPSTPTNDRLFALARVPAYNGVGMRRRFNAQLQAGAVVRNGYLYITAWDGKDYAAMLVIGLLFDLKSFDNYQWGSIMFNKSVGTQVYNANAADIPMIARVKYHDDSTFPILAKPSIDIGELFAQLNANNVLKISGMDSNLKLRILRKDDYPYVKQVRDVLSKDANGILSTSNGIMGFGVFTYASDRRPDGDGLSMRAFNAGYKVTITFAEDTPENLCICSNAGNSWRVIDGYDCKVIKFLGTRKFKRPQTAGGNVIYEGEPLAGKTFTFDSEELGIGSNEIMFVLLTGDGLEYDASDPYSTGITFYEFDRSPQPTYDVGVRLSMAAEYTWNAQLTDLNISELIHAYCACTGKLLRANRDGSFEFVNALNTESTQPNVIKLKHVSRTFSDYAQHNIVSFADADENDKLGIASRIDYVIDNVNLNEEKELDELKVNEGAIYGSDASQNILMIVGTEEAVNDHGTYISFPSDTLCVAGAYEYMQRATLQKSQILQDLCDKSTQIKVDVRITLFEYANIDSITSFIIDGTRYIWTDSSWQNDVAQFELAKVP